jgi:hypothetical protein
MTETLPDLPADPSDGLAGAVALRRLADRIEDAEVERALRDGWTWSQVADALGVTRQAVHKKHAKRLAGISASQRSD